MIESLSEKYLDSVFRLMKLNMGSYYSKRNEKWNENEIRKHFLAQVGVVSLDDSKVKGFSFYELKGNRIHIHTLQIDPLYQHRALGGRFFKWYKNLACDLKVEAITCGVYEDNPAREMYSRIGFEEIGVVDGIVRMSLPLTNKSRGTAASPRP